MSENIDQRVALDLIRYSNVWEDADILCTALEPEPGKRILSIASGGDNAFALLAEGAEVVAVDLSPAQLAVMELKRAAFLGLSHDALLGFLGARPGEARNETYQLLESELSDQARAFWQAHPELIEQGVLQAGKFERFLRLFRRRLLPLIHSRKRISGMLQSASRDAREAYFERHWNNRRWRLLFRLFCSRLLVGRLGRDPEFFRYAQLSLADHMLGRVRHTLVELSTHDNPYLTHVLTGWFDPVLPRYLEVERFEAVREGLARLTLRQGRIDEVAAQAPGFDGYNLSDIFEYLDPETGSQLYRRLLDAAHPGARLAYWNMIVPRRPAEGFPDRAAPLTTLSEQLHAQDRALFYRAFLVDEVHSPA